MEEIFNKVFKDMQGCKVVDKNEKFQFRCHKGVSCFNKCCGELSIYLSPYDIVVMKSRLGITSGEFLLKYTDTVINDETKLPFVRLKLGEGNKCVFVTPDGCTIYDNRPLVCRYYPVGLGVATMQRGGGDDFYFLMKEEHCKGFNEDGLWSIKEWREDQGIDNYTDMNKDWLELILMRKKTMHKLPEPDEKTVRMYFMGCYDVDSFRDFVFESPFLDMFDLEEEEVVMIKESEAEMMKLAHKWLLFTLYKEPMLVLKENASEIKSKWAQSKKDKI